MVALDVKNSAVTTAQVVAEAPVMKYAFENEGTLVINGGERSIQVLENNVSALNTAQFETVYAGKERVTINSLDFLHPSCEKDGALAIIGKIFYILVQCVLVPCTLGLSLFIPAVICRIIENNQNRDLNEAMTALAQKTDDVMDAFKSVQNLERLAALTETRNQILGIESPVPALVVESHKEQYRAAVEKLAAHFVAQVATAPLKEQTQAAKTVIQNLAARAGSDQVTNDLKILVAQKLTLNFLVKAPELLVQNDAVSKTMTLIAKNIDFTGDLKNAVAVTEKMIATGDQNELLAKIESAQAELIAQATSFSSKETLAESFEAALAAAKTELSEKLDTLDEIEEALNELRFERAELARTSFLVDLSDVAMSDEDFAALVASDPRRAETFQDLRELGQKIAQKEADFEEKKSEILSEIVIGNREAFWSTFAQPINASYAEMLENIAYVNRLLPEDKRVACELVKELDSELFGIDFDFNRDDESVALAYRLADLEPAYTQLIKDDFIVQPTGVDADESTYVESEKDSYDILSDEESLDDVVFGSEEEGAGAASHFGAYRAAFHASEEA